jgi:hypothetical protein
MHSKSFLHLLIWLLMWGWIDDLVLSTSDLDPANDVAVSANDEYLPSRSPIVSDPEEGRPSFLTPAFASTALGHSHGLFVGGTPCSDRGPAFAGSELLYALMSFQC